MLKFAITLILAFCSATALAQNTNEIVAQVSAHVAKIYVSFPKHHGLGSGVVVAKNKVITNCHVVAKGQSARVMINQKVYVVQGLTPDWRHDLCLLTVDEIDAPIAPIGSSESLRYEQPVYAIGYAGDSPRANANYGIVKALLPLDDSVVVQASNPFRLGDSGGGVFNEAGELVAVIAVKSPGRKPNYYNMSVEWLKPLLNQAVIPFQAQSKVAFWGKNPEQWPYFMKVVHPMKTRDWDKLNEIATAWAQEEPQTLEANYYRAVAEFNLNQTQLAKARFKAILAQNSQHSDAMYYLGVIAHNDGDEVEANAMLAGLQSLDETTAIALRNKLALLD